MLSFSSTSWLLFHFFGTNFTFSENNRSGNYPKDIYRSHTAAKKSSVSAVEAVPATWTCPASCGASSVTLSHADGQPRS
jgi:hypothetical protein